MSSVSAAATGERASGPSSFELVSSSAGRFEVRGPLTFAVARRASEEGRRALASSSAREIETDCSGVTVADSAGLAVLLEWLAEAKRAGKSLRFTGLPRGIVALAKISELDELLERGV